MRHWNNSTRERFVPVQWGEDLRYLPTENWIGIPKNVPIRIGESGEARAFRRFPILYHKPETHQKTLTWTQKGYLYKPGGSE